MYSRVAYDEEAHDAALREDGFEEGHKQGMLEALKNLIQGLQLTAEQALSVLKIPDEEKEYYLSQL